MEWFWKKSGIWNTSRRGQDNTTLVMEEHLVSGEMMILQMNAQQIVIKALKFTLIWHTHITVFMALFWDYPGEPVPEEIFFWSLDFMVQRKITNADTPTIWMGATPFGLICDTPPSSQHFCAGYPSDRNPPTCHGFGQTPNMLACIPSGWLTLIWQSVVNLKSL